MFKIFVVSEHIYLAISITFAVISIATMKYAIIDMIDDCILHQVTVFKTVTKSLLTLGLMMIVIVEVYRILQF